MALEVWYPQDVVNILSALASAGQGRDPEYHRALGDVALAFGVNCFGAETIEFSARTENLPWRVVDAETLPTK